MEILKLKPCDIQLEYPIHEASFIPRKHPNSKRQEKPQLDLRIDNGEINLCAEFGLFRQNSNEKGNINKTKRLAKMTKDMIRLSLHSLYTKCKSYFVCVADHKMCGHQLDCKVFDVFPADRYYITQTSVETIKQYVKFEMDERFFKKFCDAKISITAIKVFDNPVISPFNSFNTRTLIWEVQPATLNEQIKLSEKCTLGIKGQMTTGNFY
jgi:hypothetical protein